MAKLPEFYLDDNITIADMDISNREWIFIRV